MTKIAVMRMTLCAIVVAVLVFPTSKIFAQAQQQASKPSTASAAPSKTKDKDKPQIPDRALLEKEFRQALTGAVLTGMWQMTGDQGLSGDQPLSQPKPEKYSIQSATKLGGDFWLVNAHMEFATIDVTVPVPIRVLWAGDTAVITVDEISIPGVGKYSARVLVFGGFYSGAWMSRERNYGGILAGRITKVNKPSKPNSGKKNSGAGISKR